MTPEEFRRHGHELVDQMAAYLAMLDDGPVWQPVPDDRRARLADQPLPDTAVPFADLVAAMRADVLPHPFGNGHRRFFAWGNPAPAPEGILADLVASTMNPSCAGGDHAAIHLEKAAVRWVAELIGHPGGGVLVSGGATASLTALAAARHAATAAAGWDDRATGIGPDRPRLRLYAGDATHVSITKAAQLLGLGDDGVALVAGDAAGRLDPAALAAAIDADLDAGVVPVAAIATAGTVDTGAVDDLVTVAERCRSRGVWLHVDGSLGAFGRLDPDAAPLFAGLEEADSVAVDPHKWLSVPIDCAAVLVRDPVRLRDTFSLVPAYLRGGPDDDVWLSELVFDQTRPFRALRLWATIAGAGRSGLTERVRRCNQLARRLTDHVEADPRLALAAPTTLQVVTFTVDGVTDAHLVAALEALRREGEVFLTGTRLGGREAVRACFLNHRTTDDDVDRIVPALDRALAATEAGSR